MYRDRSETRWQRCWDRFVRIAAFLIVSCGFFIPASLPALWLGDSFRQGGKFNGLLALITLLLVWAALPIWFYFYFWRIPSLAEVTDNSSSGSSDSSGKKLINLAVLVGLVITAGVLIAKARKSGS